MWVPVAALLALTQAPQPASPAAFEQWWPEAVARLERSGVSDKETELREAKATCLRGLRGKLQPHEAVLAHYAIAYADWRLVRVTTVKAAARGPLLDEAVAQLQQAIAIEPTYAEAHALLAGAYGSKIGFAQELGMELGPRAAVALDRAVKLEPNNPRVVLQQAISAYHTPIPYGGSLEKADAYLKKALALFEKEPRERAWPNWGLSDAHVWMGQLLETRGDRAGAAAEYQKALAVTPGYAWVRDVLLPRLQQAKPR